MRGRRGLYADKHRADLERSVPVWWQKVDYREAAARTSTRSVLKIEAAAAAAALAAVRSVLSRWSLLLILLAASTAFG